MYDTDFLTPDERRVRMQAVKSKNSKAELIVFRYLARERVYFQKHYRRAPGSPDIALPRKKIAIFIDGDFWHGKTIDRVMERGPEDYWTKKIMRNMERDREQEEQLKEAGWKIMRAWERDILRVSSRESSLEKIKVFLRDGALDTKD